MNRRPIALSLPALALGLGWRDLGAQPTPPAAIAYPAFDGLGRRIEADYPDVDSVVVVRAGRVLFEHQRSPAETLHDVQSVTKSVLSLAVGAALGKGAIASLDQPVAELLGAEARGEPALPSPAVTIRQLLTMTAGYRTQERFAPGTADDPAFLLRRERVAAPGTTFAYDNLGANLLAIALEAATGQSAAGFAEQALFKPLGIAAYDWAKGRNGHCLGFSGLRLRTRDMARLGELVLDSGAWAGSAVLPEAYARAAVTAHSAGGAPVGLAYGYLWWVVPAPAQRQTFLASGWGGQFIWVHPPLALVIATTSAVSAESNRRGQALALIRSELFRAAATTPV